MPKEAENIPRLMAVGHALGPLRERVVFVGGAVVLSRLQKDSARYSMTLDVLVSLAQALEIPLAELVRFAGPA